MKKVIILLSIFSIVLYAGLKEDIAKEDIILKEKSTKEESINQQQNLRNENIKLMKEIKAKYFNEFCNSVYVSFEIDFTDKCADRKYTHDDLIKLYDNADELPNKVEQLEVRYAKELKDFFTKTISKEDVSIYKQLLIAVSLVNEEGTILPCLAEVNNKLDYYKEVIKADYRDSYTERFTNSHMEEIRHLLIQNLRYPRTAQRLKIQGEVRISFRLKRDGSVDNIEIIQSSGADLLDEDARALIKNTASQFPIPKKSVFLKVALTYLLH